LNVKLYKNRFKLIKQKNTQKKVKKRTKTILTFKNIKKIQKFNFFLKKKIFIRIKKKQSNIFNFNNRKIKLYKIAKAIKIKQQKKNFKFKKKFKFLKKKQKQFHSRKLSMFFKKLGHFNIQQNARLFSLGLSTRFLLKKNKNRNAIKVQKIMT
jgi:hypothetical protein